MSSSSSRRRGRSTRHSGLASVLLATLSVLGLAIPAAAGAADTWMPAGALGDPQQNALATVLTSGNVLVANGMNGTVARGAPAVFSPARSRWTTAARPAAPRTGGPVQATLPGNRALVAGGWIAGVTASAEVYDASANTWTALASMSEPRNEAQAVALDDGGVLVAGGTDNAGVATGTAEIYDPETAAWKATGTMLTARRLFAMTKLRDGRVLAVGGANADGYVAAAEVYDPATREWSPAGALRVSASGPSATLLRDGRILVAGGLGGPGPAFSARADVYDPATGEWTAVGDMSRPRFVAGLAVLADGTAMIVGGNPDATEDPTTEILDPVTGDWSAGPSLAQGRYRPAFASLPDGRVLVAGGGGVSAVPMVGKWFSSAELYGPPALSATDPDVVVGDVADGGTVTTDPSGAGPSAAHPVTAAVTIPSGTGATVTIAPGAVTSQAPSGYAFARQEFDISVLDSAGAPVIAPASDPLILRFGIEPGLIPAAGIGSMTFFRDGEAVPDCDVSPLGATVTVCVASRTEPDPQADNPHGVITVRSTHASRWNLAVRLDTKAPDVAFVGAAPTYAVDQIVQIRCVATDSPAAGQTASGVASSTCKDVDAPAYSRLGTNVLTATATDNAGNVGRGTLTFTVTATASGVCRLAGRFVQGSNAYKALSPRQRAAIDAQLATLCQGLDAIGAKLTPSQRAARKAAAGAAVAALARPHLISNDEAATLTTLIAAL
jgi:hypothetical protein